MKAVIVHGSYASPGDNWFPWLKSQIEDTGHEAIIPKFPTPVGQSLEAWRESFRLQVGRVDHKTILVGHSLGAGFILNLLDSQDASNVAATFLIAGFTGKLGLPDYDKINETFVSKEFNWQRIKERGGACIVINGDDDPYVPLAKGKALADALSVSLVVVPGGGHLNAQSGYKSFPLLVDKIRPYLTPANTYVP